MSEAPDTNSSPKDLWDIEIATSLIRDSPRAENVALRSWAVDVLAKNAKTVPLSPEAQADLKRFRFPIYSGGTTYPDASPK